MSKKTTALIILDGFGYTQRKEGNAIFAAPATNFFNLWNEYPHTILNASGRKVGLPAGQMGNSEVGHLTIGAGRVVPQDITRISDALEDGSFEKNTEFLNAIENCKKNDSALHLMGLLSPGGVHSFTTHLYALLNMAKKHGLKKVFVHCFMDGRDTQPQSGKDFIANLENEIKKAGVGKIATVSGRYYAMDRNKNYDRIQLAYDTLTKLEGECFETAQQLIDASYANGKTDEFVIPATVRGAQPIQDGDSVIFYNYRPDRARQLSQVFVLEDSRLNELGITFNRDKKLDVYYVAMTPYHATVNDHVHIAYDKILCKNTLGECVSNAGKTQLRIAETEKYNHVTSFFNGSLEAPFKNEERILVLSPNVETFDLKPEMSAYEVTEKCLAEIEKGFYDLIVINYANPDMVGHTGKFDAVVKAVCAVDECFAKIVDAITKQGGICLVTADHGNCDEMTLPETGEVSTKHSLNPVPFIYINNDDKSAKLTDGGSLFDIAPTILKLMNIDIPADMTGKSLIN